VCLGIPGQVVELLPGFEGQLALVEVTGARRRVNVGMLEEVPRPGDWVLIHVGFAVERVDAAGAARALEGLQLMGRPAEERP
jgi:hydrogenase assembly chaperone HypC/HupF